MYKSVVVAFQYCTSTHNKIVFSANKLCQFMSQATNIHWIAPKRLMRYLKRTITSDLCFFNPSHLDLITYSDVDRAYSHDDKKFTKAFCIFPSNNQISWHSTKQNVIVKSTIESEYRAIANTTYELLWLRSLISKLKLHLVVLPLLLHDNISAIWLTYNLVLHQR